MRENAGAQLLVVDHLGVLRRDHDLVDADGLRAFVQHADLRLAVGPQPGELTAFAHRRQPLGQPVREDDRQRHQRGRLIGRIPEHHALITRPTRVHAERDVGRLAIDGRQNRAGLRVEAEVGVGVPDGRDRAAHDIGDVDVGRSGDFAGNYRHPGRDQRFAGDPGGGILGKNRIEHRVRDLIGDLVGVPFRDRFGSEDVTMSWHVLSPLEFQATRAPSGGQPSVGIEQRQVHRFCQSET